MDPLSSFFFCRALGRLLRTPYAKGKHLTRAPTCEGGLPDVCRWMSCFCCKMGIMSPDLVRHAPPSAAHCLAYLRYVPCFAYLVFSCTQPRNQLGSQQGQLGVPSYLPTYFVLSHHSKVARRATPPTHSTLPWNCCQYPKAKQDTT
jgi:hypothetical protein